jgi:hypothetical protein
MSSPLSRRPIDCRDESGQTYQDSWSYPVLDAVITLGQIFQALFQKRMPFFRPILISLLELVKNEFFI